jgi:hypothetical protein
MHAYAYVVGPLDGPGKGLLDLARSLGFAGASPFATLAEADAQTQQTPICFFLFAATDNPRTLRGVADAIRFSPTRRLRFSPLIYFAESPSVEGITACLNMGFDDIITMPFARQRVLERLGRQIGQTQIYFETASYFGPDRRGRIQSRSPGAESRTGGEFRRFEIVRHLTTGTAILREERFAVSAA